MFFQSKGEQKFEEIERKIAELEERNENINLEVRALFKELNLTSEQLEAFVSNPENFSADNWQEMQGQKEKLDQKLKLALSNIQDPLRTKKTYSNRKVEPNWLFVR